MKRTRVRHIFLLTSGWSALAAGLVLLPVPVPMPVPVAVLLVLAGTAMLSAHSRRFRHGVRYARYRYGWLSKSFEAVGTRAPESVQKVLRRTRPDTIVRHARRRAARAGI